MHARNKTSSDAVFENFVKEVAGTAGLKVVKNISVEGATDEKIERASGLNLALVRSLLNQLNYHGIVEYTREKNMQSGWFTYTWKVNKTRAMHNVLMKKITEFENLRKELDLQGDETTIYFCPKGCGRYLFEKAMDCAFACEKCSTKLKTAAAKQELQELQQKISALQSLTETPSTF